MGEVMDFVVLTTKLGEFMTRVFQNGLVLIWKPLSVNQFMLLSVSLAAGQTA